MLFVPIVISPFPPHFTHFFAPMKGFAFLSQKGRRVYGGVFPRGRSEATPDRIPAVSLNANSLFFCNLTDDKVSGV